MIQEPNQALHNDAVNRARERGRSVKNWDAIEQVLGRHGAFYPNYMISHTGSHPPLYSLGFSRRTMKDREFGTGGLGITKRGLVSITLLILRLLCYVSFV